MRQYQVFGSPILLHYLADNLQTAAFIIKSKEGPHGVEHFFSSSYINGMLAAKRPASLPKSLFTVLKQIDPTFDRREYQQQANICAQGILAILSGIARATYGEAPISRGAASPQSGKQGKIVDNVDGLIKGQAVHSISMRVCIAISREELEKADKQNPTGKRMWELAMNNEYIARAFYYLSEAKVQEERNLYKVYEEIQEDARMDRFKQWAGGEKNFQAFIEWANDDSISGERARHSRSAALRWIEIFKREKGLSTRYKREAYPGSPCPIDFEDIIRKWIASK